MSEHPYKNGPDYTYWRRSIANVDVLNVDPVVDFGIKITRDMRVATAGSCFAQHIARYLKNSGFNYFVTESGHPIIPEKIRANNNYGQFSARYGNIYTARQLFQMFERAYGRFEPNEDCWGNQQGQFLDPFRPSAQPGGFVSEVEMRLDRTQHLEAVRRMFEDLDVFVFTLGLTECWVSTIDGAVFPLCPGVEGGEFDPARHMFHNQTVDEVVSDMTGFLMSLARVNPAASVIITVSPVPLAATARVDQHVLAATTYSKSVLRVASEMLCAQFNHVHYFPSYEIITGAFSRGAYYAEDLRNVLESGVSHVMSLFMKHGTSEESAECVLDAKREGTPERTSNTQDEYDAASVGAKLVEVECDEAALDRE
jgi:hypothetical protein